MIKSRNLAGAVVLFLMITVGAIAQTKPPTAGTGGSVSTGWTSNGTTTTTVQHIDFVGGLNIQNSTPEILRSSAAAGNDYINMGEASGIEIVPTTGQRVRIVASTFMIGAPVTYADFVDDSATTGNRTVNASRGFNALAAAATTITITNSFVTATSQIIMTIMTNDSTGRLNNCVPAAGSFTCNFAATTGASTKIAWVITK